ncbi:MAG: hypothetical protein LUC87_05095 [Clostridiales bacterium]|nr:hypothetical protein [Clostridiales bacterium]
MGTAAADIPRQQTHAQSALRRYTGCTLKTTQSVQLKHLNPGEKPAATFALSDGDAVGEVYAYCNLHGLWKA